LPLYCAILITQNLFIVGLDLFGRLARSWLATFLPSTLLLLFERMPGIGRATPLYQAVGHPL